MFNGVYMNRRVHSRRSRKCNVFSLQASEREENRKRRELIAARGAQLLYLPPYSPDLNPIELAWSKFKQYLRTAKSRTADALDRSVTGSSPNHHP